MFASLFANLFDMYSRYIDILFLLIFVYEFKKPQQKTTTKTCYKDVYF